MGVPVIVVSISLNICASNETKPFGLFNILDLEKNRVYSCFIQQ